MKNKKTRENTREKLLKAAQKLISERGYRGATTRQIASQAGVAECTLFKHFSSKAELFRVMMEKYGGSLQIKELMDKVWESEFSNQESLKLIGVEFYGMLQRHKSYIKIVHLEMHNYPVEIGSTQNKLQHDFMQAFIDYFGMLRKKGLLRDVSVEATAELFVGGIYFYFLRQEILSGRTVPRSEFEKRIEEFVEPLISGIAEQKSVKK